ncbi:hypothetical protein GCK72_011318 [Caenorhabditis remanei]|uniref:RING-type domain-containing protein n=1 Tax=Caenorhabditis remanei TaxID=31234 RepID=A0A6A5H9E7_CAERE|nr:hypothetical protein GCK72_011318 [Caenorhabditis remanei]KAF1763053.1 hypothetical protein GCK72_011318 [Caenorhabditis remanei]
MITRKIVPLIFFASAILNHLLPESGTWKTILGYTATVAIVGSLLELSSFFHQILKFDEVKRHRNELLIGYMAVILWAMRSRYLLYYSGYNKKTVSSLQLIALIYAVSIYSFLWFIPHGTPHRNTPHSSEFTKTQILLVIAHIYLVSAAIDVFNWLQVFAWMLSFASSQHLYKILVSQSPEPIPDNTRQDERDLVRNRAKAKAEMPDNREEEAHSLMILIKYVCPLLVWSFLAYLVIDKLQPAYYTDALVLFIFILYSTILLSVLASSGVILVLSDFSKATRIKFELLIGNGAAVMCPIVSTFLMSSLKVDEKGILFPQFIMLGSAFVFFYLPYLRSSLYQLPAPFQKIHKVFLVTHGAMIFLLIKNYTAETSVICLMQAVMWILSFVGIHEYWNIYWSDLIVPSGYECTICLVEYSTTRTPRMLTGCGHTICEECAGQLLERGTSKPFNAYYIASRSIRCPFCRENTVLQGTVQQMPKNYALMEIIGI